MTDTVEAMLRDRFAQQADPLPGPDFADARRRAEDIAPRVRGRHWSTRVSRPRLLAVAAVAVVLAGGGASALAYNYLRGPSAGLTAGVSSFDRLPPVAWPRSMTRVGLNSAAARVGLSPAQAESRLRLLRSGLTQGDLYAFEGANGTVCMFLTRHFGDCLHEFEAPDSPGVAAVVSRRYPWELPAVVGVVADNVTAATLVVDGRRTELAIINNSLYADITELNEHDAISLDLTYADGSTRSVALPNPT